MINSITIVPLWILFVFNVPSQLPFAVAAPIGQSEVQTSQLRALPALDGHRKKRNNAYGDEVVLPPTDLAISMRTPVEQPPARADQSYGGVVVPAIVETSGYRKKRNNAYGDEVVLPPTDLAISMRTPVEQPPARADQSYGGVVVPAIVETSGYRKKRSNAYGDEVVLPPTDLAISMRTPVEQPPARADQSYGGVVVPAIVETSGYRKKRSNAYGDEVVLPPTDLAISMRTPVEHPPARADQSYAAAATVVSSGY